MIIMLQLCFICACFYDLLFMSYAAYAISKYALCIVCFTLHVKLTKINFSGCVGQFGCVYLVWPNVHGIYTSTLYLIFSLDNTGVSKWVGTRYFYPPEVVYSTGRNY